MLNKLRPQLKILIDPIAKRININPNVLTIIGLLISILSAYMFARGDLLLGGAFILLSGFVDVIDGAVARNHSTTTPFGGILDSTADRFADAFILIGIIDMFFLSDKRVFPVRKFTVYTIYEPNVVW